MAGSGRDAATTSRGDTLTPFTSTAIEVTGEKTAKGAASGAVVGGLIGAITGGSSGAAQGAGVGAVGGGARGAIEGEETEVQVVKRCLSGRGYQVLN